VRSLEQPIRIRDEDPELEPEMDVDGLRRHVGEVGGLPAARDGDLVANKPPAEPDALDCIRDGAPDDGPQAARKSADVVGVALEKELRRYRTIHVRHPPPRR
jgi:hypothetical protein